MPKHSKINKIIGLSAKGDLTTLKSLVKNGADVNFENSRGETALFFACQRGHLETVKFLIGREADIDHRDNQGYISLFYALKHPEIVRYLLGVGVDANTPGKHRESALYHASRLKCVSTVGILIEQGGEYIPPTVEWGDSFGDCAIC